MAYPEQCRGDNPLSERRLAQIFGETHADRPEHSSPGALTRLPREQHTDTAPWQLDRGRGRSMTVKSAGLTINCVASVQIDDRTVTVALSCPEKIEALHGDLTVPRKAVVRTRAVPDGLAEVHGQRMATGWPGVSTASTARDFARDLTWLPWRSAAGVDPPWS